MPSVREISPVGRFDLGQSISFGFGQREADQPTSVMRLGFVLDGYEEQVGVAVEQLPTGALHLEITSGDARVADGAAAQVARVLSVDADATGYDELGLRDRLVGSLQAAMPGLRPPLFYSAYEALAWAVLSARRPRQQMARVRAELSAAHGTTLGIAGRSSPVLPTPAQLLHVQHFPGLNPEKIERLHGVARAALEGRLDTARLRALPVDEATARLRELPGIGPFYAELVIVRALGHTDVVPSSEPQLLALAGELVGAGKPLLPAELVELAQGWQPWRTWVCVAVRAAGQRVLDEASAQPRAASASRSRATSASSV
jgi:DNA-3-methyladenine glycosylase II